MLSVRPSLVSRDPLSKSNSATIAAHNPESDVSMDGSSIYK
jgi:hypothetical protein